jgi:hypothetical protein
MTCTMRRTWPDDRDRQDFIFFHNGKDVGRCYFARFADRRDFWRWTVYGTNLAGLELTLDDAKNTSGYRLYRVLGVSVSTSSAPFVHESSSSSALADNSLSFNPADDDTLTARVEFKVGTDRDRRCFAIGFPAKGVRRI